MSDRFTIFKGQLAPDLREIVTLGGAPVVFTGGDSVRLQGRLSGTSGALKIDAAADIEVPATGQVHYGWQTGDTDTAGMLVLWWLINRGGELQSSPAFVVPVIDQATADPGVGTYASPLDVKALAGYLAGAWTQTSDVSERDLSTFLALAGGDIDVALALAGASLPLTDPVPIAALRSLAADGALVRALDATWPSGGPAGSLELRTNALNRFTANLRALENGSSPLVKLLEQSGAAIAGQASSLWTDEAAYGLYGWYGGVWYGSLDPADYNPNLAPTFARADVL